MKHITLILCSILILFAACEKKDCKIDSTGTLLIQNSASSTSSKIYLISPNGAVESLGSISSGEEIGPLNKIAASYRLEGRTNSSIRLWSKNIEVKECEEFSIDLGDCSVDNTGFITVRNITSDVTMSVQLLYPNGMTNHLGAIAPNAQINLIKKTAGIYDFKGQDGSRLWFKRGVDVVQCQETIVEIGDGCLEEDKGYLTIENETSNGTMDVFAIDANGNEIYLGVISPDEKIEFSEQAIGVYRIEGREVNGIRLWTEEDFILRECEEYIVSFQ